MNPKNVFLLFGANDIEINRGVKKFSDLYAEFIKKLQKELPGSKIYVQLILPVMEKKDKPEFRLNNMAIKEYNEAIKKMCGEMQLTYIDIHSLALKHKGLFEPDAIHIKAAFYPLWLNLVEEKE